MCIYVVIDTSIHSGYIYSHLLGCNQDCHISSGTDNHDNCLFYISYLFYFDVQLKTPRFSRMVGRVFGLIINLSGRYRIANVICMVIICQFM